MNGRPPGDSGSAAGRSMIEAGLIAAFTLVLYFVPGYLVLSRFGALSGFERVAASFGTSFVLFGLLGFFVYLSGSAQGPANALALVAMVGGFGY